MEGLAFSIEGALAAAMKGICVNAVCVITGICVMGICAVGICEKGTSTEGFAFSMAGAMAAVSRGSRFSRGTRGSSDSRASRFSREAIGCNGAETEAFTVIDGVLTGSCADCVCTMKGFCAVGTCVEDS